MKIDVLGATYSVAMANSGNDPRLKDCDGFCDETVHEIVVNDYKNVEGEPGSKKNLVTQTKKVIRHEIVHAFFFESGLAENSYFAQNEELVDWIAIQAPKLIMAWKEANAL